MTHFPIENRADAARAVEKEISRTIVPMNDRKARRRRRRIASQPPNGGAGDRLGRELVIVDDLFPEVELAPPAIFERRGLERLREPDGRHIGARDGTEDSPLLFADRL